VTGFSGSSWGQDQASARATVSASSADATAGATAAAEPGFEPYEPGYPPEGHVIEVGVFGGAIFPSPDNNLHRPPLPRVEFRTAAQAGARLAYYPLSFAGIELEAMAAGTRIKNVNSRVGLYAGRAHLVLQVPVPYVTPFALGGVSRLGVLGRRVGSDTDPTVHFGLGVKIPLSHALSVRLDGRDNITSNDQNEGKAQTFEAMVGLTGTFERSRRTPPPPPTDSDRDGFSDSEDQCRMQAGVAPHGCPADRDADGVLDNDDYCPREAGPAPKGCPVVDLDPDKDGVPLPCDQCPEQEGVAPDGCPIRDTDGDGIFDDKDRCPKEPETKNGFEDGDGCPDTVPEAVKKFSGVVEGIYFDQGKATIRPQSRKVLDNAVKVMKDYPSITLEISGHTSSEGDPAFNQRLSQERADAVKQWLVEAGIPAQSVKTRGVGSEEPIANNKTPAGRVKNRRIEFKVIQ
jgi:OOP family OmpA-OmpF porin